MRIFVINYQNLKMKPVIRNLLLYLFLAGPLNLFCQNIPVSQKRYARPPDATKIQVQPSFGVDPLLQTSWGEGCFYNAACPVDTASHSTCFHVPAGPGAIAMAQVMNFYQYPNHGTGEHGYQHPKYGIQYANFGTTNYAWGTMPDSLTAPAGGLATLIYQCGVAQNMNYGTTRSSSFADEIDTAFVKYFGYPVTAGWKSQSDYTSDEWQIMVKTELDASHPLLLTGTDSLGTIRHYFICDGYSATGQFHINWGLGGQYNGYYSLYNLKPDTLNYTFNQRALFNLAPSSPGAGTYAMNFEEVPDFSLTFGDWTVNDVDQHDTYSITGYTFPHQNDPMAFLCFNPTQVSPSMAADPAIQPHSGQRFGACFSSNPPTNNDWFISPQVQLGIDGSFSFWIKSYTAEYGLDSYTVAVSVTDKNPGSFTVISGTQPLQTTTSWGKKTFNLSGYNNQKVYVAVHCVSDNNYLMMIDDLEVKAEASTTLSADFTADKTTIRLGEKISFTDASTGVPTSWTWKFDGGTPAASSLQNPADISYSVPGTYPVSLKISNGLTSDSMTKAGYITVTGYPVTLSLDFESLPDFTLAFNPWTAVDAKGGNTYGINQPNGNPYEFIHTNEPMAFICFNPSKTTPPLTSMTAHSGQKVGCCFSSVPPMNPNNKWLITPKMSLGTNAKIELWVTAYSNQYGTEMYNIAVSTTDASPSNFVPVNAVPEVAPLAWTQRSYDLSAYTGQNVYIGIQCVTDNSFIFMIDDISVTSSLGVNESPSLGRLVVYPNPARDYLTLNYQENSSSTSKIELVSILGETVSCWSEVPVNGRVMLDVQKIPLGIYLLNIVRGQEKVSRKVSIVK